MIFKKSDNALLFWLIIYYINKYNRASVFNQSEIGNENAANFQNKMYIEFQKI